MLFFSRTRVSRSLFSRFRTFSLAPRPFPPSRSLSRTPWLFSHSASSRISSIRLIVRRGGRKRRSEICLRREEQGGTGGRGRRKTREETDGQTDESRRRRNIKLNKRSIFCSLFLTGVELRHFATLFSLRASSPPSSPLALPSVGLPFPPLYYSLPLPLPRALPPSFFPSVGSLFLVPLSAVSSSVSFPRVSLFFSLSGGLCVETSRAEEEALYQSRVRSAWFIFYFGRGPNCKINTSS